MSGVFGYENACGERERLECPFGVCDGCPINPKEQEREDREGREKEPEA